MRDKGRDSPLEICKECTKANGSGPFPLAWLLMHDTKTAIVLSFLLCQPVNVSPATPNPI